MQSTTGQTTGPAANTATASTASADRNAARREPSPLNAGCHAETRSLRIDTTPLAMIAAFQMLWGDSCS